MSDAWRWQSFLGLSIATLFVSWWVGKRSHWSLGALLGWTLLSSLSIWQMPIQRYPQIQFRLDQTSANAFGHIALTTAAIFLLTPRVMSFVWVGICSLMYVSSLAVIVHGYGIFNAQTTDAAMIAVTLPAAVLIANMMPRVWQKALWLAPMVFAMIKGGGSTVYFVLIAMAFVLLWRLQSKHEKIVAAGTACAALWAGVQMNPGYFLDSNGRMETWTTVMQWLWAHGSPMIGAGTGTFEWLGPLIVNRTQNVFLWMHNDYLQIIFEQGIVGFGLFSWVLIEWLWRKKSVQTLLMGIGFAVIMLSHSPLRFWVGQVLALLLLRLGFEGDDGKRDLCNVRASGTQKGQAQACGNWAFWQRENVQRIINCKWIG